MLAEELASGNAPVLWLQGQSCSGCSVSLLDADAIAPAHLITRYINLSFHQTLSATTGTQAVETVNKIIAAGGYILVVEGAVPAATHPRGQSRQGGGGGRFLRVLWRNSRGGE